MVLTTYQVLARDFKASAVAAPSSGGSSKKQLKLGAKRKGLLAVPWRRVILDEAQAIHNRASLTVSLLERVDRGMDTNHSACLTHIHIYIQNIQANAVFHLEAERRWCLTGTPIANRIEDPFSLVKCVFSCISV